MNSETPDHGTISGSSPEGRIRYLDLVAILWRRRKLIAAITLVTTLLAVAYSLGSLLLPPEDSYYPNVYTPRSWMLINASTATSGLSNLLASTGLGGLAGLAGVGAGGNPNGLLATVLAKGNTMLDALAERFDIVGHYRIKKPTRSIIRNQISSRLSARMDEKSNLFLITYTDRDPEFARDMVNAAVELLEARFANLGGARALNQKTVLETKLAEVEASIKVLEGEVKKFQTRYGVIDVEALATEQVTVMARLRSELIMKEMEIANYEKLSRIDDPMIRRLQGEREIILGKIRELESGKGGSTLSRVMPSQKDLPGIAFEYARIRRDLVVQGEVLKLLTQQYELAKLNATGQDPVFQILELAEKPDRKSAPSRAMLCIIAFMGSFFSSLILTFVLDAIERIKNDRETTERFKAISSGKAV